MRKALSNEELVLSWLAAWHEDGLGQEEPIQMASVPQTRLIPPALAFCSLHTEIWMLLHLVTFSSLQRALPGLHRDPLCAEQQGMAAPSSSPREGGKTHSWLALLPLPDGSSPAGTCLAFLQLLSSPGDWFLTEQVLLPNRSCANHALRTGRGFSAPQPGQEQGRSVQAHRDLCSREKSVANLLLSCWWPSRASPTSPSSTDIPAPG